MPATTILDGPAIEFIFPSFTFGQDIGTPIPSTPYMAYTGGSAIEASGYSSYLGQVIFERDIQPWNACSNVTNPPSPGTSIPINLAY